MTEDPRRALIGQETAPVTVEIKAEEIAPFVRAIGDPNPAYRSGDHPLAPPTFPIMFQAASQDPSLFMQLNLNYASILHAEQEFEYERPLRAGERITLRSQIGDLYQKPGRSGTLDFVVFETNGFDESGAKVYTARTTLISRQVN